VNGHILPVYLWHQQSQSACHRGVLSAAAALRPVAARTALRQAAAAASCYGQLLAWRVWLPAGSGGWQTLFLFSGAASRAQHADLAAASTYLSVLA